LQAIRLKAVDDSGGRACRREPCSSLPSGVGCRERRRFANITLLAKENLASGQGSTAKLGAAEAYLCEAAPLNSFGVKWMEKHFSKSAE